MNSNKILKVFKIFSFLFVFALLSALTFEAFHHGHEENCHEEDCAICLVLQIIKTTKSITTKVQKTSVDYIINFYSYILIFATSLLIPRTLVSQKVKLII